MLKRLEVEYGAKMTQNNKLLHENSNGSYTNISSTTVPKAWSKKKKKRDESRFLSANNKHQNLQEEKLQQSK